MCGICGIINFDGQSVRTDDLRAMNAKMRHRGPDDEGYFCNGNVGFAMRRLSIIDIVSGKQPIANEDGSIRIVCNGEIYNYIERRQELIERGHKFRTDSDTEVIVHLFEEKGRDCVYDLNGMFSFALFDGRKRTVLIARDRQGIKPLYYFHGENQLIFASDLNALKMSVRCKIDINFLLHYLGNATVPSPNSIYENIRKLPPAHLMWIENNHVIHNKYWQINNFQNWQGSANEAAVQLEEHLHRSIRLQMRSDVPVGIFLSGGLDSSAVTAIAAKISLEPLHTLTINFGNKNGLDNLHARALSALLKTEHLEIKLEMNELLQGLEELTEFLDEPIADSAIVPTYLLSKIARQRGIKVLLTGAGGDEIFGGYQRHLRPSFGSPTWVAETFPEQIRKIIGQVWKYFQPARGLRATDPSIAFACMISGINLDFYDQIFKEPLLLKQLLASMQESYFMLSNKKNDAGYSYTRMRLDLNNYLTDDVLALTDKGTMAASIEGRVPLLDHRLVEFAFSLPTKINLLDNQPKGLFKKVLEHYLPKSIISRRKEGFNAPMTRWMTESFCQRVLEQLSCDRNSILNDLIDSAALKIFLTNPEKRILAANSIFSLYVFSRWEETHRL